MGEQLSSRMTPIVSTYENAAIQSRDIASIKELFKLRKPRVQQEGQTSNNIIGTGAYFIDMKVSNIRSFFGRTGKLIVETKDQCQRSLLR